MNRTQQAYKVILAVITLVSSGMTEAAISLIEVDDWSDSHLAPTEINEQLGLGINSFYGSIGQVPFDSDSFIIRNPFGHHIDSIIVSITNFTLPTYPEDFTGWSLLPGVVVQVPNRVGLVPWQNGTFPLTTNYDGSGDLVLADESALHFSIFMDSNPAIILSGGFDYEIQIATSVPEVSASVIFVLAGMLFPFHRRRIGH